MTMISGMKINTHRSVSATTHRLASAMLRTKFNCTEVWLFEEGQPCFSLLKTSLGKPHTASVGPTRWYSKWSSMLHLVCLDHLKFPVSVILLYDY